MGKTKKDQDKRLGSFILMQYMDVAYLPKFADILNDYDLNDTRDMVGMQALMGRIVDLLEAREGRGADVKVEMIAGALHDKDEGKGPHVHVYVELNRQLYLKEIAGLIGVETEYIEWPKSGRYGRENNLAYLVHAKEPFKYLYDPRNVVTLGTFDYIDYYNKNIDAWNNRKAEVKRDLLDESLDKVLGQISDGELTLKDILRDDDMRLLYTANKSKIDNAVSVRSQYVFDLKRTEICEVGNVKQRAIFITGASGLGKTRYALRLIHELQKEYGWEYFSAGTNNPLDGYAGEEIILMDDVRGTAYEASDWLKLLDNHNTSPVSARYNDVVPVHRLLIITSSVSIEQFFYFTKNKGSDVSEALDQFFRRFSFVVSLYETERPDVVDQDTYFCVHYGVKSPRVLSVFEFRNNNGTYGKAYVGYDGSGHKDKGRLIERKLNYSFKTFPLRGFFDPVGYPLIDGWWLFVELMKHYLANGGVDEVDVFDYPKDLSTSAEEIADLYKNGSGEQDFNGYEDILAEHAEARAREELDLIDTTSVQVTIDDLDNKRDEMEQRAKERAEKSSKEYAEDVRERHGDLYTITDRRLSELSDADEAEMRRILEENYDMFGNPFP